MFVTAILLGGLGFPLWLGAGLAQTTDSVQAEGEVLVELFPPDPITPGESFTIQVRCTNLNASAAVQITRVQFHLVDAGGLGLYSYDRGTKDVEWTIARNTSASFTARFALDDAVEADEYILVVMLLGSVGNESDAFFEVGDAQLVTVEDGAFDWAFWLGLAAIPVVIVTVLLLVRWKYRQDLPSRWRRTKFECPGCGTTFRDDTALYCDIADAYNYRCLAGPFCSANCLAAHKQKTHPDD